MKALYSKEKNRYIVIEQWHNIRDYSKFQFKRIFGSKPNFPIIECDAFCYTMNGKPRGGKIAALGPFFMNIMMVNLSKKDIYRFENVFHRLLPERDAHEAINFHSLIFRASREEMGDCECLRPLNARPEMRAKVDIDALQNMIEVAKSEAQIKLAEAVRDCPNERLVLRSYREHGFDFFFKLYPQTLDGWVTVVKNSDPMLRADLARGVYKDKPRWLHDMEAGSDLALHLRFSAGPDGRCFRIEQEWTFPRRVRPH